MVHGTRLRDGAETDARIRGEVGTELAGLAFVETAVVLPERLVLLALLGVTEGEDGDRGHFAVAACHAEIAGNILAGTIGTLIDAATGPALGVRIGVEHAFTVDAFADHGNLVCGWLNNYNITPPSTTLHWERSSTILQN